MAFSAAAASFLSGKFGTATIGGPGSGSLVQEFPIIDWAVEPTAMIVEFINSLSGGHVIRESTFYDVSGSLTMDWDFGNNPWAILPQVPIVGSNITDLFLYLRQTARQAYNGPYWTFSSVIVRSTAMRVAVAGKVGWSMAFAGNGAFITPPGGAPY